MSVLGVQALIVAAASAAALPFTPPAGWTELPSRATQIRVRSWQGPSLKNGLRQQFTESIMPLPLPASTQSHRLSVCRTKVTSASSTINVNGMTITNESAATNGYTYMLTYARPTISRANKQITTLLRNFCPPPSGELANLGMPSGWTQNPELNTMGVWMGNAPMQMMHLAMGPQSGSVAALVASESAPLKLAPDARVNVSTKTGTLCGWPSAFITIAANSPMFPIVIEGEMTQGNGVAYYLTYIHPASATPDPAAVASLHSLCAGSVPPSPTPTPTISQSTPATPLPHAS
jgi:hypothetical protein